MELVQYFVHSLKLVFVSNRSNHSSSSIKLIKLVFKLIMSELTFVNAIYTLFSISTLSPD